MRRNESHHLNVGLSAKFVWYIPSCLQRRKLSLKFPHRNFGAFSDTPRTGRLAWGGELIKSAGVFLPTTEILLSQLKKD